MTTLSQHSASASNAGFTYQFERALYWLAQSPAGSLIGIETDDDVTVCSNDSKLLEQDKHSVRADSHPFADRSKDLWNTLATLRDRGDRFQRSPRRDDSVLNGDEQGGARMYRPTD